eukprot:scaffold16288_cov51-Phaeocystis_antarctica.AAC.3
MVDSVRKVRSCFSASGRSSCSTTTQPSCSVSSGGHKGTVYVKYYSLTHLLRAPWAPRRCRCRCRCEAEVGVTAVLCLERPAALAPVLRGQPLGRHEAGPHQALRPALGAAARAVDHGAPA